MNIDKTKNLTYAFCTIDGRTAVAVKKRGSVSERFSHGLENEYRSQIGLETWGDNNARGDNKVDNKVDNNARGDNKVDNKIDNKIQVAKVQSERKSLNELPASCRQVFKALSEDGSLTQQALVRKLSLSRAAITKAIAILIKECYIVRCGARKNGYWEVLP